MTTVFISGLGLIGSSIARIIKQTDQTVTITGFDPNPINGNFLEEAGVIDQTLDFKAGAEMADIIFLAAPVEQIKDQIQQLTTLPLKTGVIVTDAGSTKRDVIEASHDLPDTVHFIGGHPMAGSHKSGAPAGTATLFNNATYFLVPGVDDQTGTTTIQRLLASAGCHWQIVSPDEHDMIVAELSHVPHVAAFALANSVANKLHPIPDVIQAAAGGFKDTTRIAASNPQVWTDILLTNRDQVLDGLKDYQQELAKLSQLIEDGNEIELTKYLDQAKTIRQEID
ncbi:prephenate dehydrogenase/arogenate dehydrogenase family protein [Lentilactobacillus sp. Marseille-Q4993]|uniref:prephenate dehydrogenase n=1 Tax=Lentilactobacillus sp. Marseille-Q4993 TaxID=3039492 RepID=UPI0024BCE091|nr:prephenate dehydrogenase/arogenate dehydrogenase family protein [Lentilactobacillus sp. Marseille-Q4993]